jgi:hypothetical protein
MEEILGNMQDDQQITRERGPWEPCTHTLGRTGRNRGYDDTQESVYYKENFHDKKNCRKNFSIK